MLAAGGAQPLRPPPRDGRADPDRARVDQLVAARDLNVAVLTLRQIQFGVLDMGFHGPRRAEDGALPDGGRDLDAILRRSERVALFDHVDGTFFPASFGHLLGGYDAGYYGYLWAKVYGDDMFSRFAAEGVTDPAVGGAYRTAILERGGSRPATEMLEEFLGRAAEQRGVPRRTGAVTVGADARGGPAGDRPRRPHRPRGRHDR